jgi:ABC-type sugar transport system substrate-binding protein
MRARRGIPKWGAIVLLALAGCGEALPTAPPPLTGAAVPVSVVASPLALAAARADRGATLRICVFLLIALVLAACGSETPATPTAVSGGATQPTAAPATPTATAATPTAVAATATTGSAASGGDKTIVFIPKARNATYWLALLKGAQDVGKELGYNILYEGTAARTDIARQVNIVNDRVSRKVSGILLAATDAQARVPPVEQAIAAGSVTGRERVAQDPYSMGYQGAQQLDKIIKGGQADSKQVAIPAVVVTHANLQDPAVAKLLKSYPDSEKLHPK